METLSFALQHARIFTRDLREAHAKACHESPILAYAIMPLLADAYDLEQRIASLLRACREDVA